MGRSGTLLTRWQMDRFKSKRLLALAQEADECAFCRTPNDGTIVACHSNKLKHGKGLSLKADDLVAYLCGNCHAMADGRLGWKLDQKDRDLVFYEGVFNTCLKWLRDKELVVRGE